ncbi:MAG: asparagine synthase (glutamine-hydrolyzing) [Bacteroidota bacterium]
MCGIAGIVNLGNIDVQVQDLKSMTDTIIRRGPDDEGFYIHKNLGFGFRRLSIIDISSGKQPLSNEDESIWVIMNGEIYNFQELRNSLLKKGHIFKSHSDTEVLVHLYEEHGLEFISKLRGMYAFALFDKKNNRVMIARDRVGIKPLFYSFNNNSLIFGSEIKEIKKISGPLTLNNQGILDYFTYGYTLNEKTCYNEIKKLLPAHYLVIDLNTFQTRVENYWKIKYTPDFTISETEWIERINTKLSETVNCHMIADVPLGAFLSGGVDSSAVVANMAKLSDRPIKTFSIGFKEEKYNELNFARIVSEKYKTDHHEFVLEPTSIDIINDLVNMYDEPFADSSAIPTYFLSKLTREYVTVAMSGDGGDEIFAGYNSYRKADLIQKKFKSMPSFVRTMIGNSAKLLPDHIIGKGLMHHISMSPEHLGAYSNIFKEYELPNMLNKDFIDSLKSYSSIDSKIKMLDLYKTNDFVTNYELLDINAYMVDDILTKVDRASMANSLEVRVPLLDHEFIELAFQIPSSMKLKEGEGKFIFKKSLESSLPSEILYRKKQGFALPLKKWFRNDLNALIHDELLTSNSHILNFANKKSIENILSNNNRGKRDFSAQIWTLLFFHQWLKNNNS